MQAPTAPSLVHPPLASSARLLTQYPVTGFFSDATSAARSVFLTYECDHVISMLEVSMTIRIQPASVT